MAPTLCVYMQLVRFGAGGDDLIRYRLGGFLIALEGQGEVATALSGGAEHHGVVAQLALRHLGLDAGQLVLGGVHTQHAAATLVDVAHNVTGIIGGHVNGQMHHRLQQDGIRLSDTLLVRDGGGGLKRHFGGVDGVIRAVHQGGLDAHQRIAGQHALLGALLQECAKEGVLAGYPLVGVKATLVDGSYHPVDSSEMAFKTAASIAYKEGIAQANPILLEPVMHLAVYVPADNTGDIMGDINKRRGRVLGMNPAEDELTCIEAEVPQGELGDYAVMLRSTTQGRGYFTLAFERYEEAPKPVADKVIAARAKAD